MMPLTVKLELDPGDWDYQFEPSQGGSVVEVGVLPLATERGKPGVGLLIRLEDGTYVTAWTTYNLFVSAAGAFEARYGPPSD